MRRSRRAFTLVELLTSIVCLAVFAAALFSGPFFINNRAKNARWRSIGLQLTRNAIENQRSAASQGTCAAGTVNSSPANTGIPFTVSVSTVTTDLTNGLFSVVSTATWTEQLSDGTSQTEQVSVTTEVFQNYG